MNEPTKPLLSKAGLTHWLKSEHTVAAPGWAFALVAIAALVLLGIALD